jgi:glycine/D-amino acid oxidase-like deaminating enzyme
MPTDRFDVAVIGRGLLGSSAAAHLARLGRAVVVIGPDEPANRASHDGPFGSHYDSGRITRVLDRDPFLATVAAASISRFDALEAETGVNFHSRVGHLSLGYEGNYVDELRASAAAHNLNVEELSVESVHEQWPALRVAEGLTALHERDTGGYLDPRHFIAAQNAALELHAGSVVRGVVDRIERIGKSFHVHTGDDRITADAVLLATGAFTNHAPTTHRFQLDIIEHTLLLVPVESSDAATLSDLPTVIHKQGDAFGESCYLMPPIPYPDGRLWLKIGHSVGPVMTDPDTSLHDWFRGTGNVDTEVWIREELDRRLPGLPTKGARTSSCVVTKAPTGRPYIAEPEPGMYFLVDGIGAIAKSSDEIGRIAAHRVVDGSVPTEYADEDFAARWQ